MRRDSLRQTRCERHEPADIFYSTDYIIDSPPINCFEIRFFSSNSGKASLENPERHYPQNQPHRKH